MLLAFIVSGDWKQLEYILAFAAIIMLGWGELAFQKVQVAGKYVSFVIATAGKLDKAFNTERLLGGQGWITSAAALKN